MDTEQIDAALSGNTPMPTVKVKTVEQAFAARKADEFYREAMAAYGAAALTYDEEQSARYVAHGDRMIDLHLGALRDAA